MTSCIFELDGLCYLLTTHVSKVFALLDWRKLTISAECSICDVLDPKMQELNRARF